MHGKTDVHDVFRDWTESRGIEIHADVQAQQLAGKGIGIIATKFLPAKTVIMKLPASSLVTIDSPFTQDKRIPRGLTVHGTLALSWTLNSLAGADRQFVEWEATWPSMDDITSSVPLFWNKKLCTRLSPAAQGYLANVQQKYDKDWTGVRGVLREANMHEQTFKYYWILVNSRCYYWDFAQSRKRKRGEESVSVSVDECMALCPFADYFNHGSSGCTFTSTKAGCVITTAKSYEKGEEITLPYGAHNNDYLLVEYGFLLTDNAHDCIQLDALILPNLSKKSKQLLESLNFLGDYTLYLDDTCFRTKIALSVSSLSLAQVREYSKTGELDTVQTLMMAECQKLLLKDLKDLVDTNLAELKECQKETVGPELKTIQRRWEEMAQFARKTKAWTSISDDQEAEDQEAHCETES